MKYKQLVCVEFNNCSPFVYTFRSDKPITIEKVTSYFEESEGFNEDRDSLMFLDEPAEISI